MLALSTLALQSWSSPAARVEAVDNCGKVVPYEALEGFGLGDGATAALSVGGSTPVTAVAAGGATTAVTLSTGTVLGGAAAVLGLTIAGCNFLDWVTGDGDNMFCDVLGFLGCSAPSDPGPTANEGDLTYGDWSRCATFPGLAAVSTTQWCSQVMFPSTMPANTVFRSTGEGDFTVGANNFIGTGWTQTTGTINSPYPKPSIGTSTRAEWQRPAGTTTSCRYDALPSGCTTWGTNSWAIFRNRCEAVVATDMYSGADNTPFDGPLVNVGGACGYHPQQYYVGYPNGSSPASSVFNLRPDIRQKGWTRQIVADVRCRDGIGGSYAWVRATSYVYFERFTSARIALPECPVGDFPVEILISRRPTGVVCDLGVACWGESSIITSIVQPTDLTATATAPDWVACLASGSTCDPALDVAGTCMWGGVAVGAEFCDPEAQSEPVGTDVGQVVPVESPVGDPVNTGDLAPAPAGPGGGGEPGTEITVNIPIDEGSGPNCVDAICAYDEEDTAACWPTGWGWLNPAEWVLKPIKCGLMWAFVPDAEAISDEWGELYGEVQVAVPFAWVHQAYSSITEATEGMQSAITGSEDDCMQWFPSGFAESMEPEDLTLCPSELASGGGAWSSWATFRQLAGLAVWIFWLIEVGKILFPGGSKEPEQLTLF